MNNLPEKFIISQDRIPRAWSQGLYNCCVAASTTKVLEVINYIKTGTYTMLSKGYTYGRHSRPDKTQGGMDYTYLMNSLLNCGTVPEEMFPTINEMPNIMDDVNNHPNIAELDKEAEKTKIESFTKIKGDIHFNDNVKKLLYEHQMPLVGNMVGKRHCTVIVGWDGDKLLYQDHDGSNRLVKGKFNEAYYLEGGIDSMKTFKDVDTNRWSKKYIDKVVKEGDMLGVSEDEFNPTGYITREQAAALICRLKYGME